jgi:hypothetical protein
MTNTFTTFRRSFRLRKMFRDWKRREYAVPAPAIVKHSVLRRHNIPGATWIETGTARGDTTAILADFSPRVITIEPEPNFHAAAQVRFRNVNNVKLICGLSETAFPALMENIDGDVCFWLDGHYSGSTTFQAETDTPITLELETIENALSRLGQVAVLIDDVRCFDPDMADFRDYPPLDYLVDWARNTGLKWKIEQDIFVATTK